MIEIIAPVLRYTLFEVWADGDTHRCKAIKRGAASTHSEARHWVTTCTQANASDLNFVCASFRDSTDSLKQPLHVNAIEETIYV